jgi:hydrogenase-4 component B
VTAAFVATWALGLQVVAIGATRWPRLWLALFVSGAVALLGAGLAALGHGGAWEWRSELAIGGEPLHVRLDALSGLFLALLGLISGAGAVHASAAWSRRAALGAARRGRTWWSMTVLCTSAVLLCSNGLHFLIVWEGFAVSAYCLATLERERTAARAAGWLFLAASRLGTLALIAFFTLLAVRTGSFELGPMRAHDDVAPLFWLALLGFGLKAGSFPLHVWVPATYSEAPSHVSALLSGIVGKMGLYGLLRFSGWLPIPAGGAEVVLALGAFGAVLGAVCALAQSDLKRLIAYGSVENVGVILIGVGAAMSGRDLLGHAGAEGAGVHWGHLVLTGALLHVWNDGLAKSLLFLCTDTLARAVRALEMGRLGGLWRTLPWTTGLFALGCGALCGLPPSNGFVSEWLIALGLLRSAAVHADEALTMAPALIALTVSGALVLATFVKAVSLTFLGAPRDARTGTSVQEAGWYERAPMLVLALACVLIACAPVAAWRLVAPALAAWNPSWTELAPPSELVTLERAQLALAAALVAAALLLATRVHTRGSRRALTWDCGIAAPTARMQLGATSFGAMATSWFHWLLGSERRYARPRGALPMHARFAERAKEPVLERALVGPVALVLGASAWARRRQHGRLQAYILYLVLGLLAVSAVIVVEVVL